MAQTATISQVSSVEMTAFTDLIYKTAGIRIPKEKVTLLSNRIRRRLKETGLGSFGEYLALLKACNPNDSEWDAFLQEITTHETYLFRDESHWNWLRNEYLPKTVQEARSKARPKALRVWSAAASTGDEAYSIACCIADQIHDHANWAIEIVGTDIGAGALQMADEGKFGERAMRLVPPELTRRYFEQSAPGEPWQAKPILKRMIKFKQHNLMKSLPQRPFDLIFVKNVLIYFDVPSKKIAIGHVLNALKPGGFLIAGPAEGVAEMLGSLERIEPWLYQKSDTRTRGQR